MSDFFTETVADLTDKAADVGNKNAALQAEKVLQEQKDRIDGQLAAEILSLKQSGEASSEKYRRLLGETTALSTAIRASKTDAATASVKEERLDLLKHAPQGAERAIAQADAKIYAQLRSGLKEAENGYKAHLSLELPLPVIQQDELTGEVKVAPVKAAAPQGDTEASLEASYMQYEKALRNEFTATGISGDNGFVIPSLVVDLIGYIVTYPRLYNKFKVYQTTGVEDLNVNRITGIAPASVIGTAATKGEKAPITANNVTTDSVTLRALKVAALTRITPELINTLPADMLQSRISSYLAQSLGLKFAADAISGDGGSSAGQGVGNHFNASGAVARRVEAPTGAKSDLKLVNRHEISKLFAALGGEYQSLVGGLTLATTTSVFWQLWSNLQGEHPLFTDSRGFMGTRLGPWEVCVDDAIDAPAAGKTGIFAGNFMRAWAIRYAGALRLNVSYEESFTSDQITIRAIQHYDTQPAELPAVAGYQFK